MDSNGPGPSPTLGRPALLAVAAAGVLLLMSLAPTIAASGPLHPAQATRVRGRRGVPERVGHRHGERQRLVLRGAVGVRVRGAKRQRHGLLRRHRQARGVPEWLGRPHGDGSADGVDPAHGVAPPSESATPSESASPSDSSTPSDSATPTGSADASSSVGVTPPGDHHGQHAGRTPAARSPWPSSS